MAVDTRGVALELLSAPSPQQAMSCLVELSAETSGADACALSTIDDGTLRIEAVYPEGHFGHATGREFPIASVVGEPFLGAVLKEGRIVTDSSPLPPGAPVWQLVDTHGDTHRSAIVPLCRDGTVVALLMLTRRDEPFVSGDLDRLQRIGAIAIGGVGNSRVVGGVNAMQRRALEALTTMSAHVASSDTPPLFFGKMSRSVASLAGAAGAAYWLIDDDHLGIQPDSFGFEIDHGAEARIPLAALREAGFNRLFEHGHAYYRHARADEAPHLIAFNRAHDFLAVPWKTATSMLGVLVAYDSTTAFSAQDEWIMRLAARASALVWQGYVAERRANELQAAEVTRLQDHASRVEDLERQKSDFLSLASHELRSPIGVVRGYLSMLQDGTFGELPGSVHRVLSTIEGRVDHMNDLVDQTLDAARVERSRQLLSPEDFDAGEVVRDVVKDFAALTPEPRPISIDDDEVRVHADRRQVAIIVSNLISNALKYSPQDGAVTVSVRATSGYAGIDVIDQGIGIDAQGISRLFQPFGRLGRSRSSRIEGIGIGLYLCRQLARLQGGDIVVESELGMGSTFTLRLPASTGAMALG
jgi:signal transduction histidine kinase